MFPLDDNDKGHLKRLNENKSAIFALKKLFLTTATKSNLPNDINVLAAERIAIDIITDVFRELVNIREDVSGSAQNKNMV